MAARLRFGSGDQLLDDAGGGRRRWRRRRCRRLLHRLRAARARARAASRASRAARRSRRRSSARRSWVAAAPAPASASAAPMSSARLALLPALLGGGWNGFWNCSVVRPTRGGGHDRRARARAGWNGRDPGGRRGREEEARRSATSRQSTEQIELNALRVRCACARALRTRCCCAMPKVIQPAARRVVQAHDAHEEGESTSLPLGATRRRATVTRAWPRAAHWALARQCDGFEGIFRRVRRAAAGALRRAKFPRSPSLSARRTMAPRHRRV